MIELFYIGIPVVRTDGLSGGRAVYGHVITKFSRMGSLLYFLTHGASLARFARESSAKNITQKLSFPFEKYENAFSSVLELAFLLVILRN